MVDQVSQGISFHFFHDSAAVGLYGPLGGSQPVGNLFIHHAGNEEGENLVLTGSQRIDQLVKTPGTGRGPGTLRKSEC
jgi:hypothetical protein